MAKRKGLRPHTIAQLHLRNFTGADKHLFEYDMATNKVRRTGVRNAAFEYGFLAIPELNGGNKPGSYFELFLQKYEGPAALAILSVQTALKNGIVAALGVSERDALSRFLALQFIRTPAARSMAIQTNEITRRALAIDVAEHNDIDMADPAIGHIIDQFSELPPTEHAKFHAEMLLDAPFIEYLATVLMGHVWLLRVNRTGTPLYLGDQPLALHCHVSRDGRGLGLRTYGVELVFPLSSTLQLALVERRFVRDRVPFLETHDGRAWRPMERGEVEFERSLEVQTALRFVYCETDDFSDARRECERDLTLRDPGRPRVEANAFGKSMLPSPKYSA